MDTKPLTQKEASNLANNIYDQKEALTNELNRVLVIAKKKKTPKINLFCLLDNTVKNGKLYALKAEEEETEIGHEIGPHLFEPNDIRLIIRGFKKAGWAMKRKGSFNKREDVLVTINTN